MKIHNVFYFKLLRRNFNDLLLGQNNPFPELIIVDNQNK